MQEKVRLKVKLVDFISRIRNWVGQGIVEETLHLGNCAVQGPLFNSALDVDIVGRAVVCAIYEARIFYEFGAHILPHIIMLLRAQDC